MKGKYNEFVIKINMHGEEEPITVNSVCLVIKVPVAESLATKYFNFKILHSRRAMFASIDVLISEILDSFGLFHLVEPIWWRVMVII